MELRQAFAHALKTARKARNLTQEDFGVISSRTYISTLERGGNSPTLEKVHSIAHVLGVHPLTILTMTYLQIEGEGLDVMLDRLASEIGQILQTSQRHEVS